MEKNEILSTYYNPKSPGGFGGINRIQQVHPNISKKSILQQLQSSETYTKHKSSKHTFQRRKINVHKSNYLWQADLIVLLKYAKQNKNFKYILTCIDVFSKKAYAIALKNKTAEEVTSAFEAILKESGNIPKFLQTDLGLEFENKRFKTLLKRYNINWFFVHSDKKACVVERFNRTLMMRVQKYFDFKKSLKYVDVLQNIIDSYNNSIHRSIGCSPNNVNEYNEMDVWLHQNKDLYTKKCKLPQQMKTGDFVRIREPQKTFQKGYAASFSSAIYKILEVNHTKPVTYKLGDSDGDTLLGSFYYNEISKVIL